MEVKTDSRDIKSSSESESDSEKESESDSESEEERVPRVDTDEVHKLTEEEKQWESAGHFQPKKLNISLFSGFQQAPANVEEIPVPKTQRAIYHSHNKEPQTTYEEEIPVPAKAKVQETARDEPEMEDIR